MSNEIIPQDIKKIHYKNQYMENHMEISNTLEEIATLEAERNLILRKEYITATERKRLVEIRQALPLLWAKRRKELQPANPD
jgi:hypothetical protein